MSKVSIIPIFSMAWIITGIGDGPEDLREHEIPPIIEKFLAYGNLKRSIAETTGNVGLIRNPNLISFQNLDAFIESFNERLRKTTEKTFDEIEGEGEQTLNEEDTKEISEKK